MEEKYETVLLKIGKDIDEKEIKPYKIGSVVKGDLYQIRDENGKDISIVKLVVGNNQYKSFPAYLFDVLS